MFVSENPCPALALNVRADPTRHGHQVECPPIGLRCQIVSATACHDLCVQQALIWRLQYVAHVFVSFHNSFLCPDLTHQLHCE